MKEEGGGRYVIMRIWCALIQISTYNYLLTFSRTIQACCKSLSRPAYNKQTAPTSSHDDVSTEPVFIYIFFYNGNYAN